MSDNEMVGRVRRLEKQCEALANMSGLLIGLLRAQGTISPNIEQWMFGAVRDLRDGAAGQTPRDWDRAITWAQDASGTAPLDLNAWPWKGLPPPR
jgi:hypothetical protein